jgi:hypothetical protein
MSAFGDFPSIRDGPGDIAVSLHFKFLGNLGQGSFDLLQPNKAMAVLTTTEPITSHKILEMYGPPHDCKGKAKGGSTGLRKCIRPLGGEQSLLAMMSCAACSS